MELTKGANEKRFAYVHQHDDDESGFTGLTDKMISTYERKFRKTLKGVKFLKTQTFRAEPFFLSYVMI